MDLEALLADVSRKLDALERTEQKAAPDPRKETRRGSRFAGESASDEVLDLLAAGGASSGSPTSAEAAAPDAEAGSPSS